MSIINPTKSQKGSTFLLMLIFLTALFAFVVYYFTAKGSVNTNEANPDANIPENNVVTNNVFNVKDTPEINRKPNMIEFPYKVKSIEGGDLILTGRDGDLSLTKRFITAIHKGDSKDSPIMKFEDIKVGDTVNIEIVPKASTTLFVSGN